MKATGLHFMASISLCVWLAIIITGFVVLADYEATPGMRGELQERFPELAEITLAKEHFTLIMFAHPHCPCTRSSLEELARITARGGDRMSSHLVLFQPTSATDAWSQGSALWRQAKRIPDLRIRIDSGGRLAEEFGVQTSGHVLLYDSSGVLRYEGGITSSRGHAGDNYGKTAVLSLLRDGTAERQQAPVFGCPLLTPVDNSIDSRIP